MLPNDRSRRNDDRDGRKLSQSGKSVKFSFRKSEIGRLSHSSPVFFRGFSHFEWPAGRAGPERPARKTGTGSHARAAIRLVHVPVFRRGISSMRSRFSPGIALYNGAEMGTSTRSARHARPRCDPVRRRVIHHPGRHRGWVIRVLGFWLETGRKGRMSTRLRGQIPITGAYIDDCQTQQLYCYIWALLRNLSGFLMASFTG